MKSYELHTLFTPEEAELAERAGGLPKVHEDAEQCANCGTEVGATETRFVPLGIVLSEDTVHFLCLSCAHPMTRPKG